MSDLLKLQLFFMFKQELPPGPQSRAMNAWRADEATCRPRPPLNPPNLAAVAQMPLLLPLQVEHEVLTQMLILH